MSNFTKNVLWAVLTLIVISLLFSLFATPAKAPTQLSLNTLVTDINAGSVQQIKVNGDELDITMSDGSAAVSQKEDESGVTDSLKNLGVTDTALQAVDLQVQNQSGWPFWIETLGPTLLTLLIIGAIFWFMFRQAKSGVNQAFSFGRANL